MIDVKPCTAHPGAVDLRDSRADDREDPIHLSAAEWQEFLANAKAGKYDSLITK